MVAKINKILKGTAKTADKKEPVKVFLSDEELAKEDSLFHPQNEIYGSLQIRKGSIKKISAELGESTDNLSVPKSC